jgi:hypothetical protein
MYRTVSSPRSILVFLILAAVLFGILLTRAESQDATLEPTATLEATDEPLVVVDPDGTVTVSGDAGQSDAYEYAFNAVVLLLIGILGAGGIAGIVYILKTPQQAKTVVNTGLDVVDFLAKFTKTPVDDAGLQKVREEFNRRIDEIILNMNRTPLVVNQGLPIAPGIVAQGVQPSVDEQIAIIEAQLAGLKQYQRDTATPNDPDFLPDSGKTVGGPI